MTGSARRLPIALLLAIAASGMSAAPALAAEMAVAPISPASGGSYTPQSHPSGSPVTISYEAEWDGRGTNASSLFFEVATQNTPGADGTLAREFVIDQGSLSRGDAFPTRWKGTWHAEWLMRPGTYYIQYYAYYSCAAHPCKSEVFSFTVTPPPPPAPPAPTQGEESDQATLTLADARSTIRETIEAATGRRARGLRYRCQRASSRRFNCAPTWSDSKWRWTVRFTIVGYTDGTSTYRAAGSRASRRCLRRGTVQQCSRRVRF